MSELEDVKQHNEWLKRERKRLKALIWNLERRANGYRAIIKELQQEADEREGPDGDEA